MADILRPRPDTLIPDSLIDTVAGAADGGSKDGLSGLQEAAWIEVIRKMDEVYSGLIQYEIDLEQKNAALEQAQQFIASIIASMSDILVVCDHKGMIQEVNPALLGLTGFTTDQLLDQPMTVLLSPADAHHLRASGAVREYEVRLHDKSGGLTELVALSCSPRLERRRRLPGLVIVGRPVGALRQAYEELNSAHHDLKRAQQQLIQAEKMASLGRLVAGVAHELNNPISFVYGNAHTLSRYAGRLEQYLDAVHDGSSETEREDLRKSLKIDRLMGDLGSLIEGTLEGAQRVAEIVKNLRRLSFANPTERRPLNLSEVVRNACQWVLRSDKRPVIFTDDLPEDLPVEGLEGPLHQVFVNLAQNALDATEETPRPQLILSGRRSEGQVVVTVRDNGPGIRPDDLMKVFDPFFTTKPVGKGTGLGLWVSWSIVRDHGGVLEAGNGPDGGAAFTITLPSHGAS
ncbi:MAG TPA: ATP-binding protein [Candidatus Sulfotelmatobacter sp.]|jgi:two-component system sensor histidine kinase HupT/HoxJ|nr:ATP-binding protein [Candidatus Sulfotelmatobacter sp.]